MSKKEGAAGLPNLKSRTLPGFFPEVTAVIENASGAFEAYKSVRQEQILGTPGGAVERHSTPVDPNLVQDVFGLPEAESAKNAAARIKGDNELRSSQLGGSSSSHPSSSAPSLVKRPVVESIIDLNSPPSLVSPIPTVVVNANANANEHRGKLLPIFASEGASSSYSTPLLLGKVGVGASALRNMAKPVESPLAFSTPAIPGFSKHFAALPETYTPESRQVQDNAELERLKIENDELREQLKKLQEDNEKLSGYATQSMTTIIEYDLKIEALTDELEQSKRKYLSLSAHLLPTSGNDKGVAHKEDINVKISTGSQHLAEELSKAEEHIKYLEGALALALEGANREEELKKGMVFLNRNIKTLNDTLELSEVEEGVRDERIKALEGNNTLLRKTIHDLKAKHEAALKIQKEDHDAMLKIVQDESAKALAKAQAIGASEAGDAAEFRLENESLRWSLEDLAKRNVELVLEAGQIKIIHQSELASSLFLFQQKELEITELTARHTKELLELRERLREEYKAEIANMRGASPEAVVESNLLDEITGSLAIAALEEQVKDLSLQLEEAKKAKSPDQGAAKVGDPAGDNLTVLQEQLLQAQNDLAEALKRNELLQKGIYSDPKFLELVSRHAAELAIIRTEKDAQEAELLVQKAKYTETKQTLRVFHDKVAAFEQIAGIEDVYSFKATDKSVGILLSLMTRLEKIQTKFKQQLAENELLKYKITLNLSSERGGRALLEEELARIRAQIAEATATLKNAQTEQTNRVGSAAKKVAEKEDLLIQETEKLRRAEEKIRELEEAAQLNILRINTSENKIQTLEQSLKQANDSNDKQRVKIAQLENAAKASAKKILELEAKGVERTTEIASLRAEMSTKDSFISTLQQENLALKQEREWLLTAKDALNASLEEFSVKNKAQEELLRVRSEEIEGLKKNKEERVLQIDRLKLNKEALKKVIIDKDEEFKKKELEYSDSLTRVGGGNTAAQEALSVQVNTLHQKATEAKTENTKLTAERDIAVLKAITDEKSLQDATTKYEADLAKWKAEKAQLEDSVGQLKKLLAEAEESLKTKTTAFNTLTIANKNTLQKLQEKEEALQAEKDKIATVNSYKDSVGEARDKAIAELQAIKDLLAGALESNPAARVAADDGIASAEGSEYLSISAAYSVNKGEYVDIAGVVEDPKDEKIRILQKIIDNLKAVSELDKKRIEALAIVPIATPKKKILSIFSPTNKEAPKPASSQFDATKMQKLIEDNLSLQRDLQAVSLRIISDDPVTARSQPQTTNKTTDELLSCLAQQMNVLRETTEKNTELEMQLTKLQESEVLKALDVARLSAQRDEEIAKLSKQDHDSSLANTRLMEENKNLRARANDSSESVLALQTKLGVEKTQAASQQVVIDLLKSKIDGKEVGVVAGDKSAEDEIHQLKVQLAEAEQLLLREQAKSTEDSLVFKRNMVFKEEQLEQESYARYKREENIKILETQLLQERKAAKTIAQELTDLKRIAPTLPVALPADNSALLVAQQERQTALDTLAKLRSDLEKMVSGLDKHPAVAILKDVVDSLGDLGGGDVKSKNSLFSKIKERTKAFANLFRGRKNYGYEILLNPVNTVQALQTKLAEAIEILALHPSSVSAAVGADNNDDEALLNKVRALQVNTVGLAEKDATISNLQTQLTEDRYKVLTDKDRRLAELEIQLKESVGKERDLQQKLDTLTRPETLVVPLAAIPNLDPKLQNLKIDNQLKLEPIERLEKQLQLAIITAKLALAAGNEGVVETAQAGGERLSQPAVATLADTAIERLSAQEQTYMGRLQNLDGRLKMLVDAGVDGDGYPKKINYQNGHVIYVENQDGGFVGIFTLKENNSIQIAISADGSNFAPPNDGKDEEKFLNLDNAINLLLQAQQAKLASDTEALRYQQAGLQRQRDEFAVRGDAVLDQEKKLAKERAALESEKEVFAQMKALDATKYSAAVPTDAITAAVGGDPKAKTPSSAKKNRTIWGEAEYITTMWGAASTSQNLYTKRQVDNGGVESVTVSFEIINSIAELINHAECKMTKQDKKGAQQCINTLKGLLGAEGEKYNPRQGGKSKEIAGLIYKGTYTGKTILKKTGLSLLDYVNTYNDLAKPKSSPSSADAVVLAGGRARAK